MSFATFSLQVRTKIFRLQISLMFGGTINAVGINIAAETAITDKYSRTNNFFIINSEIFFFIGNTESENVTIQDCWG